MTAILVDEQPVGDEEHDLVFTVRIRSYGKRDVVQRSNERELCRVLHHAFGAHRVAVEIGGERLVFDALADDGHHDGHDDAISRVPA